MMIYDFPSGHIVIDTDQWSWQENAYEWGLYIKQKIKKEKTKYEPPIEQPLFVEDDLPF